MADICVELGFVDTISHNAVKEILKKNRLKPHPKRQGCIGQMTGEYLTRMEDVLQVLLQR